MLYDKYISEYSYNRIFFLFKSKAEFRSVDQRYTIHEATFFKSLGKTLNYFPFLQRKLAIQNHSFVYKKQFVIQKILKQTENYKKII